MPQLSPLNWVLLFFFFWLVLFLIIVSVWWLNYRVLNLKTYEKQVVMGHVWLW